MTEDSHAAEARDHLTRLDVEGDPELEALRTEALAAVDALLARLRAASAEETEPDTADAPESWDDDEWDATVDAAREQAGIPESKGTLTTKTINGYDYYYLQWREGDTVTSQYVAPVDPT